jgi:predicted nuclease of restriction endonuclease-like (RecB) superfamily
MKFPDLVTHIAEVDDMARISAGRLVQQALSLRNWIIGAGIVEFEQSGEDRAAYGDRLLMRLSDALINNGCKALSARNLKNFRQVALAYAGLDGLGLGRRLGLFPVTLPAGIRQTSAESLFPSLTERAAEQPQLPWRDSAWLMRLFAELTFSHLLELSRIDELSRRAFYELYCLKERWSVRDLQRQRDSLLFERIGLSEKRDEILELARHGTLPNTPEAQFRDPYVFEFLGIEQRAAMTEASLEQALLDHLQHFMLELGREFCFMGRQFRITIGNRHHYLDLLFFHRRLRCLVAIDLKLGEFLPEHAGQLRFYVNYLAEHVAHPDENPPVGILLCAARDAEVVRFATAGTDDVFVTRYQLELLTAQQLQSWLHVQRAQMELAKGS